MLIYESKTIIAIPPGATLKEQLEDRCITQKELAIRLDMSEKHICKLINGEVALTYDMANKLESVLGIPARFWNGLEANYREEIQLVKEENEMDADILEAKKYPYAEISNRGWVAKTNNKVERVRNLRKFFEVANLTLLTKKNLFPNIACRKLVNTEKSDIGLIVWAQKVKLESRNIETELINISKLNKNLDEIREMTNKPLEEVYNSLVRFLASYGVALITLQHIKGTGLHGATFLSGKKIVLGMTDRGKYSDRFWFSLFHEIGHIIKGHIGKDYLTEEDEKEADLFAQSKLIPEKQYKAFVEKADFSKKSLLNFADLIGIGASIVLGRLQKEGHLKYSVYKELNREFDFSKIKTEK